MLVFTNGVFDLLHVGHIRLLVFAKSLGTRLIVGVNSDLSARRLKGPGRPVQTLFDRCEILQALRCVDEVRHFCSDTPEDLIRRLRPDILVKGPECLGAAIPGADLVESWGGKVVCPDWPMDPNHSTTRIVSLCYQSLATS